MSGGWWSAYHLRDVPLRMVEAGKEQTTVELEARLFEVCGSRRPDLFISTSPAGKFRSVAWVSPFNASGRLLGALRRFLQNALQHFQGRVITL